MGGVDLVSKVCNLWPKEGIAPGASGGPSKERRWRKHANHDLGKFT